MRYLLDVNVLIALIDPAHVQHEHVHEWFGRVGHKAFATCPITENGLLRSSATSTQTLGSAKHWRGPPAIRGLSGHQFWPDSISLVEGDLADPALLSSHSRVTDSYLLALARANKGKLATLDQKLATEVVAEGKSALALI